MIGNDIIDLQVAAVQSNWRRRGYLDKVFSRDEQLHIEQATNPDLLVWTFWSMKEAAYKAQQRELGIKRHFAPAGLECSIIQKLGTSASGKVRAGDKDYYTKTTRDGYCIHTTASASAKTGIYSRILASSANIKEELLEKVAVLKDLPQSLLSIEKDQYHLPVIRCGNRVTGWAFSITHHGKYAAFSLPLMKD